MSTTLLSRIPLHPLLFAAYAVLFLYASNLAAVLPVDAAPPLLWSIGITAIVLIVLSLAFRDARRGAIVTTALVVAFFAFGHVANAVAGADVPASAQLIAWAAVIVAAIVYAIRARASLATVTAGLNVAAGVLVILSVVTIVPYELERAGRAPTVGVPTVAAAHVAPGARKPDIYFLVFDRYGSADALKARFDITDNDLYGWLASQGFQVPKDSRGAYRATDFSLASTLNMRYLDELTETVGRTSDDRTPAQELLRHHEVGTFLKSLGYTYYHLGSWFDPTHTNEEADHNLTLGVASEFESVLGETTIVPAVQTALGMPATELTFLDRHREGTLFELRQLHRIATAPGPKFVFAHILLPHDPYVFHADGSLMTEAESHATPEPPKYRGHIAFANSQIKSLVTQLLAGPDTQDPVVILQGDEGPLACEAVDCVGTSPEYLSLRTGVLDAMYLPDTDRRLPDRFTLVNTFRFVFDTYFGTDLPLLPDHTYTWPDNDHIYDFQDITDKLIPQQGWQAIESP